MLRWIEVIGEACRAVSAELRTANPQIPWREIVGMRDNVTHGYFDIDVDTVWGTVERDLPELERQIRALQSSLG